MTIVATVSALRALPHACDAALRDGDQTLVEDVARLRDELHAVANRAARLLAAPGSTLATMEIGTPSALAGPSSTDLLVTLLGMAVDRLARIADGLDDQQWGVEGRLGRGTITVGQLIALPLHRAHRVLTGGSAPLRREGPSACESEGPSPVELRDDINSDPAIPERP